MIIFENITNSFESIFANKLRSTLSMLGIIIWVASVIILSAIWDGSKQSILDNVQAFWTNLLTITSGGNTQIWSRTTSNVLTLDLALKLKENISTIKSIAPQTSWNIQAIYQNKNIRVNVIWSLKEYFETKNIKIIYGNNFLETHQNNMAKVAIIWYTVFSDLFDKNDAIWKNIKLWNNIYEIIWVMEEKWSNIDTSIIIPIKTAQIRQFWNRFLNTLEISITNSEEVNSSKELIEMFILSYLEKQENDNLFSIRNQADMLDRITSITWTMTALLTWIAWISLLVWWIWVMNIMLVGVTERTKEIWIRKSIWAWKPDIMLQFLTESLVLSLCWWLMWIILSYIVVYLLNNKFNIISIISEKSIFLSFWVSVFIWVIFWLLPAYKAAKLRPIDALRFE